MITLKNVKTLEGSIETVTIESDEEQVFDAEGKLTLLPGMIDCHVHMRTPGQEYKEDWISGARAAIAGGFTTLFDMPNNSPSCISKESLEAKKALIDKQLKEAGIPLRYNLWLGADQNHLDEIGKCKDEVIGVKIYMGSSTGDLLMTDQEALERVFQIAAQRDLIIAVHAEDEEILDEGRKKYQGDTDPAVHSKIRDRSAAIKATKEAIALAEKYNAQLFIMHVSTKEELDLIRDAKRNHLLVYAELSPHHLFLNEEDYAAWGTKVQMNPPLRTKEDQEALWEAVQDGTADTIGSDHAPHTLEEKGQPFGKAPSGVPGLETTLPLLLDAASKNQITLERVVELLRVNPMNIYQLQPNEDYVLVDLELSKKVEDKNLKTKCGWSPFTGRELKGWPLYTIVNGKLFDATRAKLVASTSSHL